MLVGTRVNWCLGFLAQRRRRCMEYSQPSPVSTRQRRLPVHVHLHVITGSNGLAQIGGKEVCRNSRMLF